MIVGAFKETPCRLGDGDTPKPERSISVDSPATVPGVGETRSGEGDGFTDGLGVEVGEGVRLGVGVWIGVGVGVGVVEGVGDGVGPITAISCSLDQSAPESVAEVYRPNFILYTPEPSK